MPWQTRAAYYKANLVLPIVTSSLGFKQVTLLARFEAAVRHLLQTPDGSYLFDPDYGCPFEKFRTQMGNESTISLLKEEIKRKFAKYIPDIALADLLVDLSEYEDEQISFTAIWTLKSADAAREAMTYSDSSKPQKTTVLV
jgi:phage baseplate assembly protein W